MSSSTEPVAPDVGQQALAALEHLPAEEQQKVLEYIKTLTDIDTGESK